MQNALIVEDDDSVARFLNQAIGEAGFLTTVVGNGLDAVAAAQKERFDVILLDLMLPGLDGLEVCRQMRMNGVRTPVLVITAKDLTEDKVKCLDAGADDYIVKPFQVPELLARTRAVIRRNAPTGDLVAGSLILDPVARRVTRDARQVYLSGTEYMLLEFFMRNVGKTLSRAELLRHVWSYDFDGNDNVLDVYVSYLRKKIDGGQTPSMIQTVRGVGYMFVAPVA